MTLSSAATVVLRLVQVGILARLLDRDEFGLMAGSLIILRLAEISLDLGFSSAVVHRQESDAKRLSTVYWFNVGFGSLLFVLVLAVAPLGALYFDEPRLQGVIVASALSLLIRPLGQIHMALLEVELRFRSIALIEVSSIGVGLVAGVIAALQGLGVYALVIASIARSALWAGLLMVAGWRRWHPSFSFDRAHLQGYLSFGLPLVGQRYLNFIEQSVDKLIIGPMLGMEALGFYTVSWNLTRRPVNSINPILTRVAYPLFCKNQTDDGWLRSSYGKVLSSAAALNFPVYLGMYAVADPLVRVYLGPGWEDCAELVRVLSLVGAIHALVGPIGTLLLAKGRTIVGFWMDLAMLPVTVGALLLAADGGLIAVAYAYLAVQVAVLLPLDAFVKWLVVRMPPLSLLSRGGPFFACALVMAGVVIWVDALMPEPSAITKLVVLVPTGAIVYAALMLLFQRRFVTEAKQLLFRQEAAGD